ncbi:GNAT family N-acetyltransferase [Alteromonas sp. 1_MG-2023]|uniref:GNAT family N-acetyltransferase n=1 Tax=Alteromonas sp. 1_MG-2023 TaxID=3062669 RepID=UPI0026E303EA|nr:GNAT family N-acetyltransferase [Alteromonas sp. 1_MG-2023]MDO6477926.1 GNAT family N-acetyltransferase [Alteromonas sp. 1_MG-2023]
MCKVQIRTLSVDDWELYKSLRLASLQESPNAFDSTFKSESDLSICEWKSKLDLAARKIKALPLVAEIAGEPQGLVWGVVHDANSTSAHIYQMWVATESRGLGVGRLLLRALISWATELRLKSLYLTVNSDNTAAIAFYKSVGFSITVASGDDLQSKTVKSQVMVFGLNGVVA